MSGQRNVPDIKSSVNSATGKEEILTHIEIMGRTGDHCVQQNKPDTERNTTCCLIYGTSYTVGLNVKQ